MIPFTKASTYAEQHNCRHTSMPQAWFEPTIPMFKHSKDDTHLKMCGHWDWHCCTCKQQLSVYYDRKQNKLMALNCSWSINIQWLYY